jgi:hypothetical protein
MKNILLLLTALITIAGYTANTSAEPRKVVLEFCTGTWCGWCPCGDSMAEQLLIAHPNMIVIAYHGASTDPWQNFNGSAIRGLMGFAAYPTASVDRNNHPGNGSGYPYVDYNQWTALVTNRYNNNGTTIVNVSLVSSSYNESTRMLDMTVNATALQTLTSQYKIVYVLTEDNVVYPQTFYAGCGTAGVHNDYVHKWIARNVINGAAGENLNTGTWNQNQVITKTFSTLVDAAWVSYNCNVNVIVYKDTTAMLCFSDVQQGLKAVVPAINGITPNGNSVPNSYQLSQNYPNPFNPTTNIHFALPKDGQVTLKIYDALGNEVATYLDAFVRAGSYNAEIDASNWSSGIYFYTLRTADFFATKKMMLIK